MNGDDQNNFGNNSGTPTPTIYGRSSRRRPSTGSADGDGQETGRRSTSFADRVNRENAGRLSAASSRTRRVRDDRTGRDTASGRDRNSNVRDRNADSRERSGSGRIRIGGYSRSEQVTQIPSGRISSHSGSRNSRASTRTIRSGIAQDTSRTRNGRDRNREAVEEDARTTERNRRKAERKKNIEMRTRSFGFDAGALKAKFSNSESFTLDRTDPKEQERWKRSYFDFTILLLVFCLCAFGLIMLYSTTSYTDVMVKMQKDYSSMLHQGLYVALGFAVMIGISLFDYHLMVKLSPLIYVAGIFLTLLLRTPLGVERNGEVRWLDFYVVTLQPAEVVKISLITFLPLLFTSLYAKRKPMPRIERYHNRSEGITVHTALGNKILDFLELAMKVKQETYDKWEKVITAWENFWSEEDTKHPKIRAALVILIRVVVIMAFIGVPTALILDGNLSSGITIFMIGMVMFYIAADHGWPFFVAGGLGIAAIVGMFKAGILEKVLEPYQMNRINAWLHPFLYADNEGFQTVQSLYGIASGGLTGKGPGQSIQKLGYLPEAQNDMIFAIICEELGLFGALLVVILFSLLIWRLCVIAVNAKDRIGSYLVVGIIAHVSLQVLFNIAVATSMMPNTGIGLPFISWGGTALVLMMAEIGIALNVSKQIKF